MNAAASLIDRFLAYLTDYRQLAPNTARAYRADLRLFGDFITGHGRDLAETTDDDVRGFIRARTCAGSSPATVNRGLHAIRSLFRFLRTVGEAAVDPTLRLPSQPEPERLPWPLTREEINALLSVSGDGFLAARDRLLLHVLYGSGARPSDLATVDLVDVRRDGSIRSGGCDNRELFLTPAARLALARYLRLREARISSYVMRNGRRPPDAKALFLDGRSHRLTDRGIRFIVAKRGREAIPGRRVTAQTIRATFAADLLNGGAGIVVARALMGHVKVSTTERYARVAVEGLREALLDAHPHGRLEPTGDAATESEAINGTA